MVQKHVVEQVFMKNGFFRFVESKKHGWLQNGVFA